MQAGNKQAKDVLDKLNSLMWYSVMLRYLDSLAARRSHDGPTMPGAFEVWISQISHQKRKTIQ